jgi:ATP-dependent exoDNAse (exonuclease V) beta subunit
MTLTLVPAGAGSGKTHRIEKTLAQWVETGLVAPGRILAVTFTETASSELRARIRAELMARGRIDDALEIDRAYVGTIHSLGQRLLTEHAFAAGRSPASRLLTEAERDLLIRRQLARCEALSPVLRNLARFGYVWQRGAEMSAEEAFRADLMKVIDLLRGLGARGTDETILEPALASLVDGYGPCKADGEALTSALRHAAQALLAAFPDSLGHEATSDKARNEFFKDHRNLTRAAKTDDLAWDWSLWQALRNLRCSVRKSSTPEGYDPLAEAVMAAAEGLVRHPGPLEDARMHLTALVRGAQDILAAYDREKRAAGLIDYADMIAEAEALLRTREDIRAAVLDEIDCVVIDEFQDTNPVQFSLLWQLARSARHALIVGDTKQSIMGFQGADARLSEALQAAHPEAVEPLDRNWRSDPRIMALVNAVGPALFDRYDPLAPTREETGVTALEAILLPGGRKDGTADCVADRVAALLEDGEQVRDIAGGFLRPARPADVAVLCYRHAEAARVATALRARGLPVRIQGEGWLDAPATRAARAALAFVADPDDAHAALTLLTLGPPALPLRDALQAAVDGVLGTHLALAPLRALHAAAEDRPVGDLLLDTIRAAGLRDWAGRLADPAQSLADLARLEAEAQAFDRMEGDLRAAAGFHGFGPQVFLGWIAAQTERDWTLHPDPSGWSGSGVEVVTWHAAKGREWPITVVAGLGQKLAEKPGTLRAEFDSFADLDNVLRHAGLGWLPRFAAPQKQAVFADARIPDEERSAARALYVALTRARDRLILALPAAPSKEKERPERMVDLLRERAGLVPGAASLMVCGQEFAVRLSHEARDRAFAPPMEVAEPPLPRFGRAAAAMLTARTPWRRSPSSLTPADDQALPPLEHLRLGPALGPGWGGHDTATERGSAWHLAFRTLAERPDLRVRLPAATGLDDATLSAIGEQVWAVRAWLKEQGYDKLSFEVPIQEILRDGSETNAIIDCLAEGDEGYLILDHKSGACPDPVARFVDYLPQLATYAELVSSRSRKPVRQIAIHWMSEGMISVARTYAEEEV